MTLAQSSPNTTKREQCASYFFIVGLYVSLVLFLFGGFMLQNNLSSAPAVAKYVHLPWTVLRGQGTTCS